MSSQVCGCLSGGSIGGCACTATVLFLSSCWAAADVLDMQPSGSLQSLPYPRHEIVGHFPVKASSDISVTNAALMRVEAHQHVEAHRHDVDHAGMAIRPATHEEDDLKLEVDKHRLDVEPNSKAEKVVNFYRQQLHDRPRLTNGVVSCLMAMTADVFAQTMERLNSAGRFKGYDLARTRALGFTTGVYMGVIFTSWLLLLNTVYPKSDSTSIAIKWIVTQSFLQPFVYVPFFFLFHGLMLCQSRKEIIQNFRERYFAVLLRLWSLFTPARLIMFVFVPIRYQALWDSSVSFVWQTGLSLFNSKHMLPAKDGSVSSLTSDSTFRR